MEGPLRVWGNLREDFGNLRDADRRRPHQKCANKKKYEKTKILGLFSTRDSYYHHEIGFFLQILKLVLFLILALPKSENQGN